MNLLKSYRTDIEGEGSPQLKVTNRSGKMVAVHCHPSQGLWPQALSRVIRDLEITRDEFWEWSSAGRKVR